MEDFKEMSLSSILEEKKSKAENRIGKLFKPVENQQKGKGILILGMNPSGDENTAKAELYPDFFYLNYVDSPSNEIRKLTNNTYFKPIYDFANNITKDKGGCKWDWCNLDWECIETKLNNNNLNSQDKETVKYFYDNHKDCQYTIYIGDSWYIHMTKQSEFVKWIDNSKINNHIENMLNLHIKKISEQSELKAIYVNNATLSHWISDWISKKSNVNSSSFVYKYNGKKIPILFGCMLSGQRAMDSFSRNRLEKEIKQVL